MCWAVNTYDFCFDGSLSIWWWFSFFDLCPMWTHDFERLLAVLFGFVWGLFLIHSFRTSIIEKYLKNVA